MRTILNVQERYTVARTIPVGFAEAALIHTAGRGTAPYVTTIGISLVGVDPEDYVEVANLLMGNYADAFISQISNEITLDRVVLQVGLAGGTSGSVESSRNPFVGTNAGDMAPLSMAPIARKSTAELGRKGRGRMFLPCLLNRGDVDEAGNIVDTTLPALNERFDDFLTGMATPPVGFAYPPVLLHNDGSTPTPIVDGSIAPKVGWIRKRIR